MAEMIAMLGGLGASDCVGCSSGRVLAINGAPMTPEQEMLAARAGTISSSQYSPRLAGAPMTPAIAAYMARRGEMASAQYSPNIAGAPTSVAEQARAARANVIVSQQYNPRLAGVPTRALSVADQIRAKAITSADYYMKKSVNPYSFMSKGQAGTLQGAMGDWWSKQSTTMKAVYATAGIVAAWWGVPKLVAAVRG